MESDANQYGVERPVTLHFLPSPFWEGKDLSVAELSALPRLGHPKKGEVWSRGDEKLPHASLVSSRSGIFDVLAQFQLCGQR